MNLQTILYSIVIVPIEAIIESVFSFAEKISLGSTVLFPIFAVSLVVNFLALPIYNVADKIQLEEREAQKRMRYRVQRIKKAFKGDEQFMMLATYYRQNNYHPLYALRQSLSILIQIPFFIAAYHFLSNCPALENQSIWVLRDLSKPDALIQIGAANGSPISLNLLPILMTLINIAASVIYTKGAPLREKIQTNALAIIFLVILYNSPSGLVFYWTLNNVFSLVKNIFYKLKNPAKILYLLLCAAVTTLIVNLTIIDPRSPKRVALVCSVFSLVYFAPLFAMLCNYLADKIIFPLRENAKSRHFLFLTSCVSLLLALGLLIPTQLIASSPMEFSGIDGYGSPMFFVWNTFFQAMGLCLVWPALIYSLFKERLQSLFSIGFFVLLVLAILNAFIFTGNYGTLSKLLVFTEIPNVDSSIATNAINIFVLVTVAAALIALVKFGAAKVYNYVVVIAAAGLFIISAVNIRTINSGYSDYKRVASTESATSLSPVFHLSKTGKNVLLIFLDSAQNGLVEPMFEEDPNLKNQFSGFTLYKNTVAYNAHTLLGAPACYGGYEYTPEEMNKKRNVPLTTKHNEALLTLPRIFSEQADDFSVTVTDPQWANYSWIPDLSIYSEYPKINAVNTEGKYLDYWYKHNTETLDENITSETLKRNILWYGLFRLSPLAMRPAFYNSGKYWSTNQKNIDYNYFLSAYSVLEYLPKLTDFDTPTKNTFISFSSESTHDNVFLQAPDYVPVSEVTNFGTSEKYSLNGSYHSLMGAIKRVGEYLDFLKEADAYDNTKIIIYSDHSATAPDAEFEKSAIFDFIEPTSLHPILFVKDFNETGEFKTNSDFMTNADVPTLALQGIVDEPKNPFTGNVINSSQKSDGALVCLSDIFMPYHTKSKYVFTVNQDEWWRVRDNIFDPNNWTNEIQEAIK